MKHNAEGWWIEEAGAPAPCAALETPLDADVVVIGAGYLGMWTAWNLLARDNDLKVVILEAELAGHGPSGRNGGFVNGYWEYVPSLAQKFGAERSIRLAELADQAIVAVGDFCAAEKVDAWYRAVAHVEIATSPNQDGDWREAIWGLAALGIDDELVELTPDQVARICYSPEFRGAAFKPFGATVQPARLAFGLRKALLDRGVKLFEQSPVTEIDQHGSKVTVRTANGRVEADSAVLAVNWRTLRWPTFARELSVASSHIVLTEPVPDVLEEIGWVGGEALSDCRRMLHYFRTTNDGRIAFGWGGGRVANGSRYDPRIDLDPEVIEQTSATLRRFFPQLQGRAITHAWGGPIDVAPNSLPIYRSSGAVHAGWGFTGHGVGPSNLGGRILSGLALGADDEVTSCPLVEPKVKYFPPEPARSIGGNLIRAALIRRDEADSRGEQTDPVTAAITQLPKLIGMNLPR